MHIEEDPLKYQVGGNHYKCFEIQPVEFITKNKLSFLQGCIIKRICRLKLNDLDKIRHELSLIEKLEEMEEVKGLEGLKELEGKNAFSKAKL